MAFVWLVGIYALICYLYEQLRTPYRLLRLRVFGEAKDRPTLKERYGDWAAITGSSDGIGKEYAKELARHGINVVLIARNEEKLKAVAAEITSECEVETRIIVADFSQSPQVFEHLEKELDALPVTILINNVGMGDPGGLAKRSREDVMQLLNTNVVAVSELSRYFLQRLRAAKSKGAIVNVSSGTELQPMPYAALYGASKAFNRSFTLALQWEAAPLGIHVQLLSPNFVVTKINNYSKRIMQGGLFIPSAKQYARSAVNALRDGVDETSGYFWHQVQNALTHAFPWRIRLFVGQLLLGKLFNKPKK